VLRRRTREAIADVRARGVHVVVVTGRMFQSVRPYVLEAELDDPVICYQGAVVAEPRTGAWLRHVPIPLELARETPEARRYAGFQHIRLHPVGDLLAWLRDPPTKLVVIGDPEVLDELETRMKARFEERLYISKSLPYFLEFAASGVTKATGLDFLAQHLGFTPDRTIAFGDGENDVELLEWADYAVAVENAHERVKAVADLVCQSVDDEGVAQVLEAYLAR